MTLWQAVENVVRKITTKADWKLNAFGQIDAMTLFVEIINWLSLKETDLKSQQDAFSKSSCQKEISGFQETTAKRLPILESDR